MNFIVIQGYRVTSTMWLSPDKQRIKVNEGLTLVRVPQERFAYRLGNRSAFEWAIDQYQVYEDKRSGIKSDPNRLPQNTSCASSNRSHR